EFLDCRKYFWNVFIDRKGKLVILLHNHQHLIESFRSYNDNRENSRRRTMSVCPCRLMDEKKLNLDECCGPILQGKKKASTAESLMRARYSAYAEKNISFIDETQIIVENESFNKEEALRWAESSDWLGLEVKKTQKGEEND